MILTFFGLSPNYKPVIHSQIFELVYYGKGGFDWNAVYEMPIWLRRFYLKKIEEALKQQSAAKSKAAKNTQKKSPNINKPSFVPKR